MGDVCSHIIKYIQPHYPKFVKKERSNQRVNACETVAIIQRKVQESRFKIM